MVDQNKLAIFILALQKSVHRLGISLFLLTLVIFFLSPELLKAVQEHLSEKLYFFSVAGPFLSHVKLSLFGAIFLLMPWFLTVLWSAMGKPFKMGKGQIFFFVFFTCILFYVGTIFCYFVTLPLGIKFLLGFGSAELQPVISISRFVTFVTIFVLAFGLAFELPIFMVFMGRVGICTRKFFERNRRFAVLGIAIIAALITPTPDIINMGLMGGPLYFLYEAGIIILRVMRIQ